MPKVVVDHTGQTEGVFYTAGVPVELPKSVIDALGNSATPYVEGEDAKPVKKEVKKVQNKMVQKADTTTKDVKAEEPSNDEENSAKEAETK